MSNSPVFEYNSSRPILIIPEYGRHIQNMIDYARTIENKEERQKTAELIVDLMEQMVPSGKQVENYRDKLWKHLFRIADYDIDVVAPNVENKRPTEEELRPKTLPYSQSKIEFRHYGKNVSNMIAKAITMEDGPIKEGYINIIAAYMKLAYKNWNRDHYVSDENIATDIKMMSGGKLKLDDEVNLDILGGVAKNQYGSQHNSRKRRRNQSGGKRGRRRKSSRH